MNWSSEAKVLRPPMFAAALQYTFSMTFDQISMYTMVDLVVRYIYEIFDGYI
jgi:hypothetical protein